MYVLNHSQSLLFLDAVFFFSQASLTGIILYAMKI